MAINQSAITVSPTTPTLLAECVDRPMVVYVQGSRSSVLLGGPSVSDSVNLALPAGGPYNLFPGDSLYGLSNGGSSTTATVTIFGDV